MSVATVTHFPYAFPRARLPLSFTASVVVHVMLLVTLGLLLRAMPGTIGSNSVPPGTLSATIIAVPQLKLVPDLPLPLLVPVQPMQQMLPVPPAPTSRNTPTPGISAAPATVQANAEFAPVGRVSYGVGDGSNLFGAGLGERMASRFSARAARTPRLNGTLSMFYPIKGAAKGRSLALSALLMIDARGKIAEARVLPDDPEFVAAVLAGLKNAVFHPAQREGKPIPYWTVIDFKFSIEGPTGPDGKRLDR